MRVPHGADITVHIIGAIDHIGLGGIIQRYKDTFFNGTSKSTGQTTLKRDLREESRLDSMLI
jgi:hypothetical protein